VTVFELSLAEIAVFAGLVVVIVALLILLANALANQSAPGGVARDPQPKPKRRASHIPPRPLPPRPPSPP